jgi:hypothetical protein
MVISSTFNGNKQNGILVNNQDGLILLKSVEGSNNTTGDGAYLASNNNQLVCSSTFNNNSAGNGLYSSATGFSITTSLVTYTGNFNNYQFASGTAWADSTKCAVIPAP